MSHRLHFFRRSPLAQTCATRLHTTGYKRRLSPRHKHSETTLSPTHIKAKSQCDQTTLHLAPLITPGVTRPAATTLLVSTPSDSQQTIVSEDRPLTSTFPCCTSPKHSPLQVSCRLNKQSGKFYKSFIPEAWQITAVYHTQVTQHYHYHPYLLKTHGLSNWFCAGGAYEICKQYRSSIACA